MNDTLIIALIEHLDEDEAVIVQDMLYDEATLEEICGYINRNIEPAVKSEILDKLVPVHPELENLIAEIPRYLDLDQYPPSVRREMEYCEYIDQLNDEEQEYIKQFYHEYYNKGFTKIPEDERILKTDELLKIARRVNNSLSRDAFTYTANRNLQQSLEDQLVVASEPEGWEHKFVYLGYESALEYILIETLQEIDNSLVDNRIALIRCYIKMERLRKMNNRDIKSSKERRNG